LYYGEPAIAVRDEGEAEGDVSFLAMLPPSLKKETYDQSVLAELPDEIVDSLFPGDDELYSLYGGMNFDPSSSSDSLGFTVKEECPPVPVQLSPLESSALQTLYTLPLNLEGASSSSSRMSSFMLEPTTTKVSRKRKERDEDDEMGLDTALDFQSELDLSFTNSAFSQASTSGDRLDFTVVKEIYEKAPHLYQNLRQYSLLDQVAAQMTNARATYRDFKRQNTKVPNMQREFFKQQLKTLGLSPNETEGLRQFTTAGGKNKVSVGEAECAAALVAHLQELKRNNRTCFDLMIQKMDSAQNSRRSNAKRQRKS
jgi:hypothetical protein